LDLQNVNSEDDGSSHYGADVFLSCEGSIFIFKPRTLAAKQWIDENVQPDAQRLGNALVVEWRLAAELAAAIRDAGIGSFVR